MAKRTPPLDAHAELLRVLVNKRFNPRASPESARKAIAELALCKAAYVEWREADSTARRVYGRSSFGRTQSEQTQSGLQRINRLAERLHRELTELPTGRRGHDGTGSGFIARMWTDSCNPRFGMEPVSRMQWHTVVESVSELARVTLEYRERGRNTKRGTPGLALRRAYAVNVGAGLERAGYKVTNSGIGAFARVMALMLTEVGEKAPADMRPLAQDTRKRLRNPPAYLRILEKRKHGQ